MSILVVSVSHKSTSVSHLAQLALDAAASAKLAEHLVGSEHIDEAIVLSTCNRTEVYASVSRFHGALDDATEALADVAGLRPGELRSLCAVFFDEGQLPAPSRSPPGLDSLVVGESQILGQVKNALTLGQTHETVGTVLNCLVPTSDQGWQAGPHRDGHRRSRSLARRRRISAPDRRDR